MVDRPLIFSAPMVRALIGGRKTQTRRLARSGAPWASPSRQFAVGDRVWVREAWRTFGTLDHLSAAALWPREDKGAGIACEAGGGVSIGPPSGGSVRHYDFTDESRPELRGRLRPSIHMPRWASRLTLAVTEVRVQRLQEIDEADAIAEGIERIDDARGVAWKSYETYPDGEPHPHAAAPNASPITSYRELWTSLHGPAAWEKNQLVSAISFQVILANIDAQEARAA